MPIDFARHADLMQFVAHMQRRASGSASRPSRYRARHDESGFWVLPGDCGQGEHRHGRGPRGGATDPRGSRGTERDPDVREHHDPARPDRGRALQGQCHPRLHGLRPPRQGDPHARPRQPRRSWTVSPSRSSSATTSMQRSGNSPPPTRRRALEGERARLVEFILRDLRRAGHELPPEARATVKERTQRLVELGVRFQEQHRRMGRLTPRRPGGARWPASTASPTSLEIDEEYGQAQGDPRLPPSHPIRRERHAPRPPRAVVVQVQHAGGRRQPDDPRGGPGPASSRLQRTSVSPSWSHHRLEDRMAKDPERVAAFYEELSRRSRSKEGSSWWPWVSCSKPTQATARCGRGIGVSTTPNSVAPTTASIPSRSPTTCRSTRCSAGCSTWSRRCSVSTSARWPGSRRVASRCAVVRASTTPRAARNLPISISISSPAKASTAMPPSSHWS